MEDTNYLIGSEIERVCQKHGLSLTRIPGKEPSDPAAFVISRGDKALFRGTYYRVSDWIRGLQAAAEITRSRTSRREASLGLDVGQLRSALDGHPDTMEVVVRAASKADAWICGGITSAHTDTGCNEDADGNNPEFFAIEVSDDEDDFETSSEG